MFIKKSCFNKISIKYHNKKNSNFKLWHQNLYAFNFVSIFVIKVKQLNSMLQCFGNKNEFYYNFIMDIYMHSIYSSQIQIES
jgi:hypothetical protein